MSILLDAGPSLNFLAVGQQNVLIQLAQSNGLTLAVPARVDAEIEGMCNDPRFARTGALGTWRKLKGVRVQILDDSIEEQVFAAAVGRVSGVPAADRVRSRKSLGEIMVIAHASVLAQGGETVFVLIDEGDGRRRAAAEANWLRKNNHPGALVLWSTRQVLEQSDPEWLGEGTTWQAVYNRMSAFDDGLRPLA